jgi:hypothetical protein
VRILVPNFSFTIFIVQVQALKNMFDAEPTVSIDSGITLI